MKPHHDHHTRLLRLRDVTARTGLARSTVYALAADGRFPPPIKLTPKAVAWIEDDVDKWIEERIRETREAGAA